MSESAPSLLLVEDEFDSWGFVGWALKREGFDVDVAQGVKRGRIEAATRPPDLVVLDLGLSDGDGADPIRDLRAWSDVPVRVLSARICEDDRIGAGMRALTTPSSSHSAPVNGWRGCAPTCDDARTG